MTQTTACDIKQVSLRRHIVIPNEIRAELCADKIARGKCVISFDNVKPWRMMNDMGTKYDSCCGIIICRFLHNVALLESESTTRRAKREKQDLSCEQSQDRDLH